MIKNLVSSIPCKTILAGLAAGLFLATPCLAQPSNAPTEMKPTVVTGSYIPVSEGTTVASPVDIVTSTKIDQAGAVDIVTALKKVDPAFTGNGNLGAELNNNSSNPGEGNVALRNLPTLVLLNGRRLANSALSSTIGGAVDIFTIPVSMIDRIEVLKDGASAQYGSDAIGGVVNIIMKKNFNGAEVGGRYGFATDEGLVTGQRVTEQRVWGIGGATTEDTQVFVGADYYHLDPLFSKDRLVSSASIPYLSTLQGGQAVGIAPGTYVSGSFPGRSGNYILAGTSFAQGVSGAGPVGGSFTYIPGLTTPPILPGNPVFNNVVAYNNAAHAALGYYPYVPIDNTPVGQSLRNAGVGSRVIFNTTQYGSYSESEQDRRTAYGSIDHNIFEDKLIVYGNFLFADNTYNTQLAPAPIPALGPAGLNSIAIPADNPYNPFGQALGVGAAPTAPQIRSRTLETGTRTSINETEFYNFVGGLRGDINEYVGYDGAFNYSISKQTLVNQNSVNGLLLNQALIPTGATGAAGGPYAGLPLSTLTDQAGNNLPVYNLFGLAGVNNRDTIQALRTSVFERGHSEMYGFDGHFYGNIFDLPAGKLKYAVGGGYMAEALDVASDGLLQSDNAIGYNPNPSFNGGKRTREYGFAQIQFPIFSPEKHIPGFYDFEVTANGRIEHWEPGGDSEVPQIGIKWKPVDDQVELRGTFSEGFVAPPLFYLFGPVTPNNPTVNIINPVLGSASSVQVTTSQGPNANLPPANSVNWDAGITIKPKFIPGPGQLTITVDYYNVDEEGISALPDYNQVIQSLNALGSASPYASGFTFANNSHLTTPAPNQIAFSSGDPAHDFGTVAVHYQPEAAQRTDGIDLGATYEWPTENWGKFTLAANANIIRHFQYRLTKNAQFYEYSGQYTSPTAIGGAEGTLPDFFITDSLTWDYKGFSFNVASRFVPSVTDFGDMFPTAASPVNDFTYNGKPWTVDSWYAIDLQLSYRFGEDYGRWLNGLRLAVGCNNITDNAPPFISSGSEDNTDKVMYDILGRFVYFEISKKF